MPILHEISPENYAVHATQLFIHRSGGPHTHVVCARGMGHIRQKKYRLFRLLAKIFIKRVVFMFSHDIAYTGLLYCVTNFELDGFEIE